MLETNLESLLVVAAAVAISGCGLADEASAPEKTPVPAYNDQNVRGFVQGEEWEVQSARVRTVENADNLFIQVYGTDHAKPCAGLQPEEPSPEEGDRKLSIEDVPPEEGRYEFVSESDPDGTDDGKPELSFLKSTDETGGASGVPYARGWIEVVEISDSTFRAKVVGVHGTDDDNKVSGRFEAERCGCFNC